MLGSMAEKPGGGARLHRSSRPRSRAVPARNQPIGLVAGGLRNDQDGGAGVSQANGTRCGYTAPRRLDKRGAGELPQLRAGNRRLREDIEVLKRANVNTTNQTQKAAKTRQAAHIDR